MQTYLQVLIPTQHCKKNGFLYTHDFFLLLFFICISIKIQNGLKPKYKIILIPINTYFYFALQNILHLNTHLKKNMICGQRVDPHPHAVCRHVRIFLFLKPNRGGAKVRTMLHHCTGYCIEIWLFLIRVENSVSISYY